MFYLRTDFTIIGFHNVTNQVCNFSPFLDAKIVMCSHCAMQVLHICEVFMGISFVCNLPFLSMFVQFSIDTLTSFMR